MESQNGLYDDFMRSLSDGVRKRSSEMKFTDQEYARQRSANKIHELEQRVEELDAECDDLGSEVESLKAGITYWSYCTWEGMRRLCTEKDEELKEYLRDIGVSGY